MDFSRVGQTLVRLKQSQATNGAATTAALMDCYVATSPPDLAEQAYLDMARSEFADMVLSESTIQQLNDLQKAYLSRIFLDNDSPSGVVAIFQGDPGSGKTMAAESLASALKLPLYRIDYSMLEVEGESSLLELFTEAERNSAMLLFDEADTLFTQKKDPNGPGSLITAFLIQKIETYGGLAVLTTNAKQKIDPAFFRRADTVISFPPLTVQQRFALFQKLMAAKGVKIDSEINLAHLVSTIQMSGRNISNIINNAILSARAGSQPLEDVVIAAEDLAKAIRLETK
jgi:SpoVK/Ycf46/Vps4 family AAA+-type ATPase